MYHTDSLFSPYTVSVQEFNLWWLGVVGLLSRDNCPGFQLYNCNSSGANSSFKHTEPLNKGLTAFFVFYAFLVPALWISSLAMQLFPIGDKNIL